MEVRLSYILCFFQILIFSEYLGQIYIPITDLNGLNSIFNSQYLGKLNNLIPSKKSTKLNQNMNEKLRYNFNAIQNCIMPVCDIDELNNVLYETVDDNLYQTFIDEDIERTNNENMFSIASAIPWSDIPMQMNRLLPQRLALTNNFEMKQSGIKIEPKGEINMGMIFVGDFFSSSFKVTNLNHKRAIQIRIISIDRLFIIEPSAFNLEGGITQVVTYRYLPSYVGKFHYTIMIKDEQFENFNELIHLKAVIQKNLFNINTIYQMHIPIGKTEQVDLIIKNPLKYPVRLACITKTNPSKWLELKFHSKKTILFNICPNVTIEPNQVVNIGVLELKSNEKNGYLEILNYFFNDFEIRQKVMAAFEEHALIISPKLLHFGKIIIGRNLPRRIPIYCQTEKKEKLSKIVFKESPTTNYLENFLVDLSTSQESSQYCFPKKTLIGYIAFYSQIRIQLFLS